MVGMALRPYVMPKRNPVLAGGEQKNIAEKAAMGADDATGLVKEGLGSVSGREYTVTQTGINQNIAHEMALQYYKVSPYSVYHPDVINMQPKWWNDAWFDFWEIER